MMDHKVDVLIVKSYNWDCPKCGGFNHKTSGLNEEINSFTCECCGAEIKYNVKDGWIWEEA